MAAPVPVAELVRTGRVRELRGIGPGIEARLRELVETGEIAELAELERELAPGLVGLGRYLGLEREALGRDRAGARRPHARRASRGGGGRPAADRAGDRAEDRGAAAARRSPARPSRDRSAGSCSTAPGSSWAAIAAALDGEAAGDVRRWRDSCERLAVVCAAPDPSAVLARFAALPADRRRGRAGRAARGRRDGRGRAGRARRRRAGALRDRARARDGLARVRRGARAAAGRARRGGASTDALGLPWCPPELREEPFRGEPPALVEPDDIRGDLHCHTTWSDGTGERRGDGPRRPRARLRLRRDLRPHAGRRRGPRAHRRRRPPAGRGDRGGERGAGAVPRPARDRVRHPRPTGGSTSPTTSSPSSTGCRRACTAGSGCRGGR